MYVCVLKRLRPIPPGLGNRIWNLGRVLLYSTWTPKHPKRMSESTFPGGTVKAPP